METTCSGGPRPRPHGRRLRAGLVAGAVALLTCGLASSAQASHFRFAHNTWRRVSGNTVEFTSTQAWRQGAEAPLPIDFGDGASDSGTATVIGSFTDLAGEGYTILRYTVQHAYAGEGPFVASMSSCCRISTLVNAADGNELMLTAVDLRNGNQGSPVSSIPVILQMTQGGLNSVTLPTGDPDLDPIGCRMSTATESEIPAVATAGGFTLAVSPACVLSWDTSGTSVGQKYAVQVMVEETHAGNVGDVAIDFIIEIVGGTLNQPPACAGISGQQVVNVGQAFQAMPTGTDPDGDALTVSHLGLPPGATLTPPSGTQQASPFTATFDWTPQASDAGSAHAVTIVFTDTGGLQATCSFSIAVPLCGDGVVDPPAEQCDPGAAGSCPAGQVCTSSCACALPTDTPPPTDTPMATPTDTPPPSSTPTETPTATPPPAGACPAAPVAGCFDATGAHRWILQLRDDADARRDRLVWKWHGDGPGIVGALGNPTAGTSYALCLYAGATPALVATLEVPNAAACSGCWRAQGTRGFRFRSESAPGGMRKGVLRTNPSRTRAQMKLFGGGAGLSLPAMPLAQPVLAQLIKSDGPDCWQASYSAPAARNTSDRFVDSAD